MTGPLAQVQGITKRFGGFVALNEVSFEIAKGERLGLIGPNGSGKTTLVNCISGLLRPDAGQVVFDGRNMGPLSLPNRVHAGISRTFQIPRPFPSMTVVENILVPLTFAKRSRLDGRRTDEDHARTILNRFGLSRLADKVSAALTQVDLRKLELARAFAANPTLLIADETLAGLSSAEVDEVVTLLLDVNAQGVTIIMIEHIMRAVMRFSQRVICLDAGRLIANAEPQVVVNLPEIRRAYLGA